MLDSRAGRVLEESGRRMLDDDEFDWVGGGHARARSPTASTHLIIGTSLPWLLPHADPPPGAVERDAQRPPRGPASRARLAEKLRQAADLEHWAAFGDSFERLGRALVAVARGEHGPAPATALVLSGDVHHAYAAELVRPRRPGHAGCTS